MKQYYCLLHKRWYTEKKLKDKCLNNKSNRKGAKYRKCKHLIILEEQAQ